MPVVARVSRGGELGARIRVVGRNFAKSKPVVRNGVQGGVRDPKFWHLLRLARTQRARIVRCGACN